MASGNNIPQARPKLHFASDDKDSYDEGQKMVRAATPGSTLPPLNNALELQNSMLYELEDAINTLIAVLEPILGDEPPSPAVGQMDSESAHSAFTSVLEIHTRRIGRATQNIHETVRRLQG